MSGNTLYHLFRGCRDTRFIIYFIDRDGKRQECVSLYLLLRAAAINTPKLVSNA
jgi:hypothetical protein